MSIIQSTATINGEEVTILIESGPPMLDTGRVTRSNPVADTLKHAQGVFGGGVDLIRHCAMQVVQGIQGLDALQRPEELEVQLAIKLGSDAGALLVSLSAEAQMPVTMKWKFQNNGKSANSWTLRLSVLAVQSLFSDSLLDFCRQQTTRRNVY